MTLNKVGSGYTLAATGGTLTSATSSAISVTSGTATQLLITAQPASMVTAGAGFGFTVTAEDAEGNLATGFTGSETVALASNPGSSTLGGTLTVSATSGVASFSGLTLNKVGSGYTLAADQRHACISDQQCHFRHPGHSHATVDHHTAGFDRHRRQWLWVYRHGRRCRRAT